MKIQELRKKMGLRQEDVAKELNLDRSAVAKWETGEAKPTANNLLKLAEVLNCSVDDLLR